MPLQFHPRSLLPMTLIITHALPESGSGFHKQTLHHVPEKTARQIANDFESFAKASHPEAAEEAVPCTTYEYALSNSPSETADGTDGNAQDEQAGGEANDMPPQPEGFVAVDFRSVVAVQGYDRLS